MGIDSVGKNLLLGECKYSFSPKGSGVLRELRAKTEGLRKSFGAKVVRYAIFNPGGFKKDLMDEAKKDKSVLLIDKV